MLGLLKPLPEPKCHDRVSRLSRNCHCLPTPAKSCSSDMSPASPVSPRYQPARLPAFPVWGPYLSSYGARKRRSIVHACVHTRCTSRRSARQARGSQCFSALNKYQPIRIPTWNGGEPAGDARDWRHVISVRGGKSLPTQGACSRSPGRWRLRQGRRRRGEFSVSFFPTCGVGVRHMSAGRWQITFFIYLWGRRI